MNLCPKEIPVFIVLPLLLKDAEKSSHGKRQAHGNHKNHTCPTSLKQAKPVTSIHNNSPVINEKIRQEESHFVATVDQTKKTDAD